MAIITAIIDLAQHLQLEVIAEGVEPRPGRFLVAYGCCCMQGYYFSRPASEATLLAWCEAGVASASRPRPAPAAACPGGALQNSSTSAWAFEWLLQLARATSSS
jgi:predicted signal transduction protein with EAL and GGDEF domain